MDKILEKMGTEKLSAEKDSGSLPCYQDPDKGQLIDTVIESEVSPERGHNPNFWELAGYFVRN